MNAKRSLVPVITGLAVGAILIVMFAFYFQPLLSSVNCSSFYTYQLKIDNTAYPMGFRLNGAILNMTAEEATKTLLIQLKAEKPTSLQIAVPRDVLDSRAGPNNTGADSEFAVFVDDTPVSHDEYSTKDGKWATVLRITDHPEKYRILLIPVEQHNEMVAIVATWPL